MDEQNTSGLPQPDKETLWYLDNYILLKDYLDRTISRIAARCIRKGNIAMEEYPFYGYILDVLEEISDTGEFILNHKELYPFVEKKIQGGMIAFKKNLNEYRQELKNNSTPEMIKSDSNQELEKMKEALGDFGQEDDPTAGAGMSMDAVIEKLMSQQNVQPRPESLTAEDVPQTQPAAQPVNPTPQQPMPQTPVQPAIQPQAPQAPRPATPQPVNPAPQQPIPQAQVQPAVQSQVSQAPRPAAPQPVNPAPQQPMPQAPAAPQTTPNKVSE